jgi:hybrid cluster-associated redox disulfide protein
MMQPPHARPPRPRRRPRFAADLSVATALERWPPAAQVFLAHRMACVGCAMARFDTLRDAAATYQLPLDRFLLELTAATPAAPTLSTEIDP